MSIESVLNDTKYMAALINRLYEKTAGGHDFRLICQEWIDEEKSAAVTRCFHQLLPPGIPYMMEVIVERNPDTRIAGTCVDADEKRQRYFVVSVIPDTEYPYNYSYPLIHQMWITGLYCWEVTRATLAACTKEARVVIAKEPVPPILNNARIEWASLYLGRKTYEGISRLSEQWADAGEFDGIESDVHLFQVREMEQTELLQRLIDAYDEDYPVGSNEV